MTRIREGLLRLATAGVARSSLILLVLLYLWWRFQLGGLTNNLITGWLVLAVPLVVASVGVTLLIIMGEFDLSAAGVVTLVDVLLATTFSHTNPILATLILIAIGAAIGLINGVLVVYSGLPAIAVTLATLIILNGLALVRLGTPGGTIPNGIINALSTPSGIPRALILIILIAVAWIVFRRTRLGIYVFAVGADSEALGLAGISVNRVRTTMFAVAGGLYGLAGVCLGAGIQTGDASSGSTYLLSTFAAVALGGTAFIGGSGTGVGSILGALILTIIPKVLFVLGISDWVQTVVTGGLIILAVLVSAIRPSRSTPARAADTGTSEEPPSPATIATEREVAV